MRMWMVDPRLMCRQHLLGEHVEIHMLVGSLRRGNGIQGFVDKKLLDPRLARDRHDALVAEMERRGYHHASPLKDFPIIPGATLDPEESWRLLRDRCPACGDPCPGIAPRP